MFLMLLPMVMAAADPGANQVEVEFAGLRSAKGVLRICLTQERRRFPDCNADPRALRRNMPAAAGKLLIAGFAPGTYALTVFHDENANGKLDTLFGIPREGFGFSRNPVVRFGPPRYENVSIQLGAGYTRLRVRLQYLL